MHEQTAKTPISLNIDIVWSESLLSAWTNAQADLSLFVWLASHFVGLNFQEFAQIYGNYNRNDKKLSLKNALCEYRIILNVLIVCLFL